MAALERYFSDPLPAALFVDTDILIAYLIESEPHHERTVAFLDRIATQNQTLLYVSSLAWIEFANVVGRERFRVRLPAEVRRHFRLHRWPDASVRRIYYQSLLGALDDLLRQYTWREVHLSAEVRELAVQQVLDYKLRPHDAVRLASARLAGAADLASCDEAYRSVDDLLLWNDRIHTPRR